MMTHASETAPHERIVVTVFEHHDTHGANLDVAVMYPHRWQLLTVDEARELASELFDAADLAEECSGEFEIPLRTR